MPPVPSASRPYRLGTWVFLAISVPLLALAVVGLRGLVPRSVGLVSTAGFLCCLGLAALFGLTARRKTLENRERGSAGSMLLIMAGMLKQQDDATLERIAASHGPAAEAAALLLKTRRSNAL